jgi:DNA-binding NtrC family response regulator
MGYPRILVVDDEENFLSLVTKVLGKEGYEVRTAADGNQAWAWLEKESFDLALIDIRMVPIGGLSLLNQIKESHPQIRVIMITAYPTPETRDLASLKGAVAYLVKPIDINELKDTVRGHLLPK